VNITNLENNHRRIALDQIDNFEWSNLRDLPAASRSKLQSVFSNDCVSIVHKLTITITSAARCVRVRRF